MLFKDHVVVFCSQILFLNIGNKEFNLKESEKLRNTAKVENEQPGKHMRNTKQDHKILLKRVFI